MAPWLRRTRIGGPTAFLPAPCDSDARGEVTLVRDTPVAARRDGRGEVTLAQELAAVFAHQTGGEADVPVFDSVAMIPRFVSDPDRPASIRHPESMCTAISAARAQHRRRRVRRRWAWAPVVIAVALTVACRDLVDPPLPSGAVPFTPPPVYARWWAMTEACSGMSGSMERVRWYIVPGATILDTPDHRVNAYWSAGTNQIVLAGAVQRNGGTVRHEMLHSLARRSGHPRELYLRRCAGVVRCAIECIEDAEPPRAPSPAAVAVGPDALTIGVEWSPERPLGADGDGFITLMVTVRNTASYPVQLKSLSQSSSGFFYEIGDGRNVWGGSFPWLDAEATSFRPGEIKRHAFDIPLAAPGAPGLRLLPGEYTLSGGYGKRFTSIVTMLD